MATADRDRVMNHPGSHPRFINQRSQHRFLIDDEQPDLVG
jgi:hypothetical protein